MEFVENPKDYLEDLLAEIDKAGKTILIQTMNFEYGKIVGTLEKYLIKASGRGVDVRINYDWVAEKYIHGDLPLFPTINGKRRKYVNRVQKKNREMYERLENGGIKLTITNNPSFPVSQMPYLGRSHIKMAIVDEKCAWVGGVNLYDGAFENIDIMVKTRKPSLISALTKLFYQVNENKKEKDIKVKIDEKESLFIDVGDKGKSIIYDTAKLRIKEAKNSLIFISQYVPDTKLLKEITEAAQKGVMVTILTSPNDDPNFTKYPEKLTYIVLKSTIEEIPNIKLIHLDRKVHAKVLIIDDEVVMYGSHNYTYSGVLFGTAEIMIETREEEILQEFRAYIQENIS
jgi:phosphatidylserine/phosphatidylglycerophosphate/cardiolipin synthase-like enzyme